MNSEIQNSKMSRGKKVCFLVFPIVIFVILNIAGVLSFWGLGKGIQGLDSILVYIGFTSGIFHLVFVFVYIMHVISNQRLNKAEKWVWSILVYCLSVIGMVIYWYKQIRKD
jgi:hypothetical protein